MTELHTNPHGRVVDGMRRNALANLHLHFSDHALRSEIWGVEDRGVKFPTANRYLVRGAYPDQSPAKAELAADALEPWIRLYAACCECAKPGGEWALDAAIYYFDQVRVAERILAAAKAMKGSASGRKNRKQGADERDDAIRAAMAAGEVRADIATRLGVTKVQITRALKATK
jgi:hypothetical protein